MVGHTHQDFLSDENTDIALPLKHGTIDLFNIKDFTDEINLFDIPGKCFRKISISFIDEYIDNLSDWNRCFRHLIGIDRLYLINDRPISNPIMRNYGQLLNKKYLSKLLKDGIPATIIEPLKN